MSRHIQGHRVASIEDLEEGGDYYVKLTDDGRAEALWFAMPGFPESRWNRIGGQASTDKTRWDIVVETDESVTVSPSILSEWSWGEEREQRRFHAFLKGGVWEVLDDTIGAHFD